MSEGLHFALLEEETVRVRGHSVRLKEEADQIVRGWLQTLFDPVLVGHHSDIGISPIV